VAKSYSLPGLGYFTETSSSTNINLPDVGYLAYTYNVPVLPEGSCRDVTSWFLSTSKNKTLDIQRKFTISGSDFSDRVIRWPTIKRDFDRPKPTSLTIPLANDDKALNTLINDLDLLTTDCILQIGLTHPTSGDEFIDLFKGTIASVSASNGKLNVSLLDRFKGFSETLIGDTSSDGAVSFTSSEYYPGDLLWTMVTCYGGLSGVESSTNPDIDYNSWTSWKDVFEEDTILMQANFTGQKMSDFMLKMSETLDSAFVFEDNKLRFYRLDATVNSLGISLGDRAITEVNVLLDDKKVVNRQKVSAAYDVSSSEFQARVVGVNSASQGTYNVRESSIEDSTVWLTNSASALNLTERLIYKDAFPYREYGIDTTFEAAVLCLGDGFRFNDLQLDVSSATDFMVSGNEINMDTGAVKLKTRALPALQPFILDVTTFQVLDKTYNFLL